MKSWFLAFIAAVAVALIAFTTARDETSATTLSVALDIQGQGLNVVSDGVGLTGIGSGTANISLDIGGTIQAALLYWAGKDTPCPESPPGTCVIPFQPYKDQVLRFDGNLITGTIIGTENQPPLVTNNIGFLADVTAIVQAKGTGSQSFSIQDGDTASNLATLDGAALYIIFTDAADTAQYRVILYDALDFADANDQTAAAQVTVPVTFNHGSVTGSRTAQLIIGVGDAESSRADRIDISNNTSINNSLDSSDGNQWDLDQHTITIPSGVSSTTVQLFSVAATNTDSFLWEIASLRVPLSADPATSTPTASPNPTSSPSPTQTPTQTRTAVPDDDHSGQGPSSPTAISTNTPTATPTGTPTVTPLPASPGLTGAVGSIVPPNTGDGGVRN